MSLKRVLIIVYYWPPSGGSGVQRWVKFAKHLRSFGWEPIIYTPENPFVTEFDESLLKEVPADLEVLKLPVFEVSKYFGAAGSGAGQQTSSSLFARIKKQVGSFVRSNFFIPDPRVLWVAPSVKFLSKYLAENKIDAIVSSGPPNSMHLIAMGLKEKFNIPWLADFRDPWMEVLKFHDFNMSGIAWRKHQSLFNGVLKNADSVVVVHPTVKSNFQPLTSTPVHVITNGYDENDLTEADSVGTDAARFKIVFVGILYDKLNALAFWQAIAELNAASALFKEKLQLIFVGKIKEAAMQDLTECDLQPQSQFVGYVEHSTAVGYEKEADVLLLFTPSAEEFKYIIPGKLFEYLAVQKPILCVAPEQNDSAQIVLQTKSGTVVSPLDKEKMKKVIIEMFTAFQEKTLNIASNNFDQYERKQLTAKLADELNRISK